jgi:peptidoglycan/xylan/chitin deacetylase (PgdA/CDA1 family)
MIVAGGMEVDAAQFGVSVSPCLALFGGAERMPRWLIRGFLQIMRGLGLFHLARYLTRYGLRIICYHGFALADEYEYRGRLFIRDDLFRRRILYLRKQGYPILPLGEALEALSSGRIPPCATVITMDDGWRGVYSVGLPIIKQLGIPVTVYVATYYVENPMPVFTVTCSYLFWRAEVRRVTLPSELGNFDLTSQADQADELAQKYGAALPPAERLKFLKELADALEVPFADIEQRQLFRAMDKEQLRQLGDAGVDIQLHSHRHEWPLYDRKIVEAEILENRRSLERVASRPLEHFCYPSGIYGLHQGEWLAALGVKSATTIDPGLNFADTSPFALRRFVDGHPVTDIEFAAEISGFMELVRALSEKRLLSMLRVRWFSRYTPSGLTRPNCQS